MHELCRSFGLSKYKASCLYPQGDGFIAANKVFFGWLVIVRQICKPQSHAKGILKTNWDLRGPGGWLGQISKKLWCFYCVYSDNMNNAKKLSEITK